MNPAPEPYDFLASFQRACETREPPLDFARVFDGYFEQGYVFKGPDYLLLGQRDSTRDDAWLIFWAEAYPRRDYRQLLSTFVRFTPFYLPYIGWARPGKNRHNVKYYSTDRLLSLTNPPNESSAHPV